MTVMGAITCCRDCKPPERQPGCHATCERFLKEREEHLVYTDKVRKAKKEEYSGISRAVLEWTTDGKGKHRKKGQP